MVIFNIAFFKIELKWLLVFFSISAIIHVVLLKNGYKPIVDRFVLPFFISISLMSLYKTFFAPITDVRAMGAFGAMTGSLLYQTATYKR